MTNNKTFLQRVAILLSSLLISCSPVMAQITWPQGQLLPSFPATSSHQDLIYLNGTSSIQETTWRWEAEGANIGHKTGRLETDGWLCQTGVDAPNEHMLYGPYDRSVTAGLNTAEFRMKIDNNTANNDVVVDVDVRDANTGAILASQSVTRQQFTVAGNYTSFRLPFVMPTDNTPIELRVYWRGNSYIKIDYVSVQQNNYTAENYLFSSLKGVVNRTQPRIFSYEGDNFAEGPYTWMQSLGLTWTEQLDKWTLIMKYRSEINGLIVYDPAQPHTVNLATMLSKDKKALIASPSQLARLTSAPYNLPILVDLRGQFTSKLQVYQTLYNTYWPSLDHRLLIGLSPDIHQAALREYACAVGAAVIWLDPNVAGESELLNSFLSSMTPGGTFMGWWQEEGAGVTRASQYGIATVASDYATNLTVHSGMPRTVNVKPIPPKPALQNKIYVAFILSDGDNLQYVEHLMRKLWNNPDRGSVPIGWTVSPAMLDAMPGGLNYYHQSSTNNDNLISGPSGWGYAYPNNFPNQASLDQFVAKTEDYNRRAGLRVITIWNTITGGINPNVGQSFATYAPSTLGLTGQNTGGPLSIYNNSMPGQPLSCNYCTGEQAMKDHIASASSGWNGNEPRFIIIQAQPWTDVKPTNFKNVANSLGSNYVVVRPDHLFMLMREKNGLTIDPNPNPVNGNGDGLTGSYFNGKNFETPRLSRKDANVNFDWASGSPATSVNADNFSARWTGQIQPRYSGEYTFYMTNDDGGRLWINNQLVIDKWRDDGGTEVTGKITLTAGQKYDIKMEYYENGGGARAKLDWSSQGQVREVVPTSQLYANPVPTISITSPANNATYNSPAAVTINVNASDNNSVAKVDFYNGTTLLGTDNTAPYSFTWNNVGAGAYSITAVATDNLGAFSISSAVSISVNSDPLAGNGDGLSANYFNGMNFETLRYSGKDATLNMNWGSGSPNAAVNADLYSARWTGQIQPRYSGEYTFYITSDNGRRVWINNQLIIDQWVDNWDVEYTGKITLTAQQRYDIKVEYFENNGGANIKLEWSSVQQSREVVPMSQLYSNTLPTVSLSSSATTAIAPANLTLSATSSDADGIAKVDFYNGTTLLGTDNTSPYNYVWNNVAVGTYSITALATDSKGGVALSSATTVTISNAVNKVPVVSIATPANNSIYTAPANVSFTASASDPDGTVSKVEYFNGSASIGSATASPYSVSWNNVAAGTYTITAKATDNQGAVTTSAAITVKINPIVVTNPCTGVAQYVENGSYVAGSLVQNAGNKYQCKPYPYSGWCNGAAWAYAPGVGAYWQDAWTAQGSCAARMSAAQQASMIAPNPTTGTIQLNLETSSQVYVYNTYGMEVVSAQEISANGVLDLSALPAGMYLLKIDTGNEVISQTVIKK